MCHFCFGHSQEGQANRLHMVFFIRSYSDLGRRRVDPAFGTRLKRCSLAAVSGGWLAGDFDVCVICTLKAATGASRHIESAGRNCAPKRADKGDLHHLGYRILGNFGYFNYCHYCQIRSWQLLTLKIFGDPDERNH